MVLEARLLAERLATHLAHIRLLARVYILMMALGFARGERLLAVLAAEGLQLKMHRPDVRLQLEFAGKETAAMLARQLLGAVHEHVLDEHETLGQTTPAHLALVHRDARRARARTRIHSVHLMLLHRVILERVAGVKVLLAYITKVLLAGARIGRRLVGGGMLGAPMILEIRCLVECGAALLAHVLAGGRGSYAVLEPLVLLHGNAADVDALAAGLVAAIGALLGAVYLLDVRVEAAHEAVGLVAAIALEGSLAALVHLAHVRLQRQAVRKAVPALHALEAVLQALAATPCTWLHDGLWLHFLHSRLINWIRRRRRRRWVILTLRFEQLLRLQLLLIGRRLLVHNLEYAGRWLGHFLARPLSQHGQELGAASVRLLLEQLVAQQLLVAGRAQLLGQPFAGQFGWLPFQMLHQQTLQLHVYGMRCRHLSVSVQFLQACQAIVVGQRVHWEQPSERLGLCAPPELKAKWRWTMVNKRFMLNCDAAVAQLLCIVAVTVKQAELPPAANHWLPIAAAMFIRYGFLCLQLI